MRWKRAAAFLVAATVGSAIVSGCGADKISEPWRDAPRGRTFDGAADVVTMPDGFSNLATKCGPGGMRYTVVFHGDSPYGSVSVVLDATCPK